MTSQVIKHATTQHIQVWAPATKDSGPIVFAVPGIGGSRQDFDQVGPAIARRGVVFFATDYRATGTDQQSTADLVCGFRYARSLAADYGGDTSRPVTLVGYSMGAYRIFGALQQELFGPGGSYDNCFQGTAIPDVLVAIDGCYYAYQKSAFNFPVELFTNKRARLVLLSGQNDDVCQPWQSQKAATALNTAGFDTTLIPIPDANHYEPIFHDLVNGKWSTLPDSPAGNKTVQTILDAIRAAT